MMPRPLTVVFLVDALGWEIVEHFRFGEDLFAARGPLETVLGYSSAAIPSLMSGRTPVEHGAWSMYRLDRGTSPFRFLRLLPRLPHAIEWRTRNLVRRWVDRKQTVSSYYDLYDIPLHLLGRFDLALYGDVYRPAGLGVETVVDAMEGRGVRYRLWYYKTPESENMSSLVSSIADDLEVLFLYTAELDALMHRKGIFAEAVAERLRLYERFLSEVLEASSKAGREASILLLSDHGMTNVEAVIDPWSGLEERGIRLGKDYLAFYDSTMARLWCDDRVRAETAAVFEELGGGRLLAAEELEAYGCLFPNREYGNSVFLADPGVMIVPSFMGRSRLAAMHGYAPEDRFSKGVFMTNDKTVDPPASILDFKNCFLTRLEGAHA